jgi:hypothetical protein
MSPYCHDIMTSWQFQHTCPDAAVYSLVQREFASDFPQLPVAACKYKILISLMAPKLALFLTVKLPGAG